VLVIPDIYLNAGGVTVSYFEWLKNLSHVRFGRMEKRYMQAANERLMDAIEKAAASGKKLSKEEKEKILTGPDELSLVYSGLEETMITAYDAIRETYLNTKGIPDMRTAAFVTAINKILTSYSTLGIFP
jgi:glutamate dehydrogenase (NAD(P)+)